jgi:universal stress protein E
VNPIRSILVIVDPSASEHPAVAKAAVLAEKFSARLELFACDTKASRNIRQAESARRPTRSPHDTDLKAMVERLAAPLRERGLDVTTESVSGEPLHTVLLERVKHTCAELVVKDTHHHTLAQRTFLTNTDWELIRGCPAALLLTKPKSWTAAPRICAAVDPGHEDDKPRLLDHCILDTAAALAQRLGGELHVVHAYIPTAIAVVSASEPTLMFDVPVELQATERRAKLKELMSITSDHRVMEANVHLEAGGTAEVLCRLATELQVDIMAMGAISRSAVKRAFVGSTAESVLEHLPCDLLIAKAPNFAELLPL